MQISGKGKVANKWINNQIDKTQFDFENKGKVASGSFQWTDVKKGKNGAKDEFTTTVKRFATFDADAMQTLERTLGNPIEITGKLVGSSYVDKEGKNKKSEQIIIESVKLAEKPLSQHSQQKGNAYQPDDSWEF